MMSLAVLLAGCTSLTPLQVSAAVNRAPLPVGSVTRCPIAPLSTKPIRSAVVLLLAMTSSTVMASSPVLPGRLHESGAVGSQIKVESSAWIAASSGSDAGALVTAAPMGFDSALSSGVGVLVAVGGGVDVVVAVGGGVDVVVAVGRGVDVAVALGGGVAVVVLVGGVDVVVLVGGDVGVVVAVAVGVLGVPVAGTVGLTGVGVRIAVAVGDAMEVAVGGLVGARVAVGMATLCDLIVSVGVGETMQSGGVTVTTFVRVPVVPAGTTPLSVNIADAPTARLTVVWMLPVPAAAPQVFGALTRHVQLKPANDAGTVSSTRAPITSLGPLLVTTMV